ncbi:hypothetical protein ACIPSE_01030 [Streptomyces sp. NPDC090106]|uniref:hypothetical protein n=1 Tax=Streptomyces sp. NPDC090106 TaxID=3365946 RepID=UPI0037F9AF17
MLVDVVDDPDEVTYVTDVFEQRGWTVRPAEPGEAAEAPAHRRSLVVEVRLHGARFGALRTATAGVERLVRQAALGAWVRDAALVEHERPPVTTYHVHRVLPGWGGLLVRLGLADAQRAVTVAAGPSSRDDARTALTARDLGGRAFDPATHEVRVPAYADGNPPGDETARERRVRRAWTAAGGAGAVLAILCGMSLASADGWWRLLPAVLSTAGALPMALTLKETRNLGRRAQWAAGLAGTTALASFGALVGQDTRPEDLWQPVLIGAAAAFVGIGVVLALRRTAVTRHTAWLIPLSVPVLWPLVAWLGGQMHGEYLNRFDIRADAVPTPSLGRYMAAAEPMALAFGSVLFFLAVAGWLRHFHAGRDAVLRVYGIVLGALLAVLFPLFAIALGAERATSAADRSAERVAAQGAEPADYFGLQGRLVCLRPVDASHPLPVDNGPAPTGHPVLSFGTGGDWIWLWDPARHGKDVQESFAVRREDVQLIPAENPRTRTCPAP